MGCNDSVLQCAQHNFINRAAGISKKLVGTSLCGGQNPVMPEPARGVQGGPYTNHRGQILPTLYYWHAQSFSPSGITVKSAPLPLIEVEITTKN